MLENITKYRSKLLLAVGVAALVGVVSLSLSGCAAVRDTAARAFGLPTSADIAAVQTDRDAAAALLAEADARVAGIESERDAAAASAAVIDARRGQLAEQHATLAGQYAAAVVAGSSRMATSLQIAIDGLRLELAELDNASAAIDDAMRRTGAMLSDSIADRGAAEKSIAELDAELENIRVFTAERLSGVEGLVRSTGAQLTAWGIPGVAIVADEAASLLGPEGLIGSLLLGGAGAGYVRQRRKTTKTTRAFAEVIAANDTAGVITQAPERRDAAKQLLSTEARTLFLAAKAEAVGIADTMRGSVQPAPTPPTG